ncbi:MULTISPECIES: cation-transporting ATPase [unclassified Microbacterium]|uniref:cation-transporting ATPase n=1 Tax=unclassified Microbacterium TaxID=2609290 RepID=UPI00386D43F6
MGKLSRLIGMASKALDSSGSSRSNAPTGGSTDWRSVARSAMNAVSGDGRNAATSDRPAPPAPAGYTPPPASRYTPPAAPGGYAPPAAPGSSVPPAGGAPLSAADRQAIARYDYLLQTADPHQVEQIHRDAFARLTPEQRAHLQSRMRSELPPNEQPRSADPADLARAAARSEAARPGMLKGLLARASGRGGSGGGGRLAGGLALGAGAGILGAVAGGAILTAVGGAVLENAAAMGVDFEGLAQGVDLDAIAQGVDVEGFAGEAVSGLGEHVSGLGEQVSGFGENLGGFGLGGFFDR